MIEGSRVVCDGCGLVLARSQTFFLEVRGYVRSRKGGGANAIYARVDTGRALCPLCFLKHDAGQQQTFEGM